ncbi:RILP-like protein 1 isoform X2 [Liolophura sinensis]|uniref:RILP-like protein 1 isoform X2 n=1 Tax=Liolophura sinensis TaxID=3198878 RepID=UPI00315954B0
MDTLYIRRRMMDDDIQGITVVDVYDQASMIGKEFEKIIDIHGVDAVTDLMPKVIRCLEQLEVLANKNEKENHEIVELRYLVEKLENQKAEAAQMRVKYEQELEQIEDNWRQESQDLVKMTNKLQEENRNLKVLIRDQKETAVIKAAELTKKSEEEEIRVLTKLKETVDKQREQIRKAQREMSQKAVDCEALQAQLERMAKVNADLRRKNTTSRKQARGLLEEKADLQTQIQDKENQIAQIQRLLHDQDSTELTNSCPASPGLGKLPTLNSPESEEEVTKMEERLSQVGKLVIDMKDPNRPRFTLSELKEVLLERNELKTKLIEVEEELEIYKPKSEDEDEDDFAVQGPINREPEDKLYPERFKKEDSGIRKFFQQLIDKINVTLEMP